MTERTMDAFAAAMIADGEWELAGVEASEEAYVEAYQHLIDTGMAWSLQGRIGREAVRLIEDGQCRVPPTYRSADDVELDDETRTRFELDRFHDDRGTQ